MREKKKVFIMSFWDSWEVLRNTELSGLFEIPLSFIFTNLYHNTLIVWRYFSFLCEYDLYILIEKTLNTTKH